MSGLWRLARRSAILAPVAVLSVAAFGVVPTLGASGTPHRVAPPNQISFRLFPNPPFVTCLQATGQTARVNVTVDRGSLNDELTLKLSGFKPGLNFDLFTVQNSPQKANGDPNPNFTTFGLAWYQSDVHVRSDGTGTTKIKTILLDQIFGFDPAVSLAPTNTFHVGFWFNDPADAAPCGFTGTTPFNGEHAAGPLAFVSRPNGTTKLGPLCTNPTGGTAPACIP